MLVIYDGAVLRLFVTVADIKCRLNAVVLLCVYLCVMKEPVVYDKDLLIRPHPGFQESFASSSVDVVFGGGSLGGGKSAGLVLALAEPLMTDGSFRALISRRNLGNLKSGGGFIDTFRQLFGEYCEIRQADSPRVSFDCGSYCDLTYIDDNDLDVMRERAKGWQYDVIAIDEITEMSWEAFSYVLTRNRGMSKTFTGKFFATLNPKRSHWTRYFLDWYVGVDGFIMPERNGVVRYFYAGDAASVKDVTWGSTKEEVYSKSRIDIDRKLRAIGGNFTYKNLIKSFVFYQGKLSENLTLVGNNPDYIGSVAASGGRIAQALFEGNFNVDPDEAEHIPIPSDKARKCFTNDPAVNGDRWVTVDLADYGADNVVAIAWNGFHAVDIMILTKSTPRLNAERLRMFARENATPENRMIYDATSGRYFSDYVPDAIPYISASRPSGIYALTASSMKDLCYLRLCRMIESGGLTFSDKVATTIYVHQHIHNVVTVQNEFMEECAVVRFTEHASGRMKLMSKKEMNRNLGRGRSMDLLDPCAMRMYPCTNMEYGTERSVGSGIAVAESASVGAYAGASVYDDDLWN